MLPIDDGHYFFRIVWADGIISPWDVCQVTTLEGDEGQRSFVSTATGHCLFKDGKPVAGSGLGKCCFKNGRPYTGKEKAGKAITYAGHIQSIRFGDQVTMPPNWI